MCGIVGAVSPRNVVPVLIDGIRRLEYRGYDSTGLAVIDGGEPSRLERLVSTARVADLAAQAEARADHRLHRHLAHALGDARRADAGERASARLRRRDRGRAQRHHRELRGAARGAQGAGLRLRHPDRHRGDRPPDPRALAWRRRRGSEARGGGSRRAIPRRVCDRRDVHARTRADRRRARGEPAGRGPGRRRPLPRLRCGGAAVRHPADRLPRGRRRRRRASRVLRDLRRARRARRAGDGHRRGVG